MLFLNQRKRENGRRNVLMTKSPYVPFVSPDLNALSAQMVWRTSVSAYGVCVLCLSLEALCVKFEEGILQKSLTQYLEKADSVLLYWHQCVY